jgi:hypothetical protein
MSAAYFYMHPVLLLMLGVIVSLAIFFMVAGSRRIVFHQFVDQCGFSVEFTIARTTDS